MFRTLIYPSSGACDYSVELPHWSSCSWFGVCWRFGVHCFSLQHGYHSNPHRISNTHRTNNKTSNVVIQQNSRKLLAMDILMSETCWAHKKWNKIASVIKSVFNSSTTRNMCSVPVRSASLFDVHFVKQVTLCRGAQIFHTSRSHLSILGTPRVTYRVADKSLARPGRKQASVSVRMAWIFFGALPCKKKNFGSSRLDVVEIARVPDMLPSLFPSWSG